MTDGPHGKLPWRAVTEARSIRSDRSPASCSQRLTTTRPTEERGKVVSHHAPALSTCLSAVTPYPHADDLNVTHWGCVHAGPPPATTTQLDHEVEGGGGTCGHCALEADTAHERLRGLALALGSTQSRSMAFARASIDPLLIK